MARVQDDRGQATVLILGAFLLAFGIVAFGVDGTRAFLMRRTLQNAADAAALAGASEISQTTYYGSGGRVVELDGEDAERIALAFLERRRIPRAASISVSPEEIRVVIRTHMPTTFLRVVGLDSVPVAVEAAARPLSVADL